MPNKLADFVFGRQRVDDDIVAPALDRSAKAQDDRARQRAGFAADLRAAGLRSDYYPTARVVRVRDGDGFPVCDVSDEEIWGVSSEAQAQALIRRLVDRAVAAVSQRAMNKFGAKRLDLVAPAIFLSDVYSKQRVLDADFANIAPTYASDGTQGISGAGFDAWPDYIPDARGLQRRNADGIDFVRPVKKAVAPRFEERPAGRASVVLDDGGVV